MREKGVLPRYEIEDFDKHSVYAVKAPHKNKTKNKSLSEEIYGYVIGKKGQKVVDAVEDVGYTEHKASSRGGRDYGTRVNNNLTRKTLRSLIPVFALTDFLKNNTRNEPRNK